MAHDFEDMHNIEGLDDTELRDLVREQLREHAGLDIDEITVHAREGKVTLSGRVGTLPESSASRTLPRLTAPTSARSSVK